MSLAGMKVYYGYDLCTQGQPLTTQRNTYTEFTVSGTGMQTAANSRRRLLGHLSLSHRRFTSSISKLLAAELSAIGFLPVRLGQIKRQQASEISRPFAMFVGPCWGVCKKQGQCTQGMWLPEYLVPSARPSSQA